MPIILPVRKHEGITIHTHQLKKNKGPEKEKMTQTLMNNCEKVNFLLLEVSENLSLMGMCCLEIKFD